MSKWAHRMVGAAGVLVGVVLVAASAGYGWAAWRYSRAASRIWPVAPVDLGRPGDARRGGYLVRMGGCLECHGDDLGGSRFIDSAVAGRIMGSNLTPAGLGQWSDGEIARAIHHGVGRDGRGLVFMPVATFQHYSREDVAAMVAYLRRAPAVNRPSEPARPGPLFKALWAAGRLPDLLPAGMVDHAAPFTAAVPAGPTRGYGRYLFNSHCAGCHRMDGRGGPVPGGPPDWPPAANLTVDGAGGWTRAGFLRAMRTAVNPSGSAIRPPMGEAIRRTLSNAHEDDLIALWEYLRTLKGEDL